MRRGGLLAALICMALVGLIYEAITVIAQRRDDHSFVAAAHAEQAAGTKYETAAEAYQKYLAAHPKGRHATAAQSKVGREIPGLIEDREWQTAAATNTFDSYQAYLKRYADEQWRTKVRQRLASHVWILPVPSAPAAKEQAQPKGNPGKPIDVRSEPGVELQEKNDPCLWELNDPSGKPIGSVGISAHLYPKFYVSDNAVVTVAAQAAGTQQDEAYSVLVKLRPPWGKQSGNQTGVLTVKRSGGEAIRIPVISEEPLKVRLPDLDRKTDRLEWQVTAGGHTTEGVVSFITVGTAPDLVFYDVYCAGLPRDAEGPPEAYQVYDR